ncbi:hypothetical protein ABIF94_004695 [Bradyrhizobium ottawaense]
MRSPGHDAQHQRAGRQAGTIDHHALAALAHLLEQIEERPDLSARRLDDADFSGRGRGGEQGGCEDQGFEGGDASHELSTNSVS